MFKKFFSGIALFAILALILAGAAFLAKSNILLYFKNKEASRFLEGKKQEFKKLNKEKETIEKNLKQLEEPAGLERIARERFMAKKPGEEVLIITEETPPKQERLSAAATSSQSAFWQRIFKFFKRD